MARSSLEANYDSALLGRLGRALAYVYDDTVQATLPPALQALVDRLHEASPKDCAEAEAPPAAPSRPQ